MGNDAPLLLLYIFTNIESSRSYAQVCDKHGSLSSVILSVPS
jgi:hypothetical protein